MPDFDKTFENEVSSSRDKEIYQLKKDMAIKVEEIQALYLEVKSVRKLEEDHKKLNGRLRFEIEESKKLMTDNMTKYKNENHSLKQQIKQLEKENEEMLLYP
jgi:DNA-dependent RNA polymerase auxiliary subunit epsilon